MKPEILFRGKRVDNGEWVQGHYALDHQSDSTIIELPPRKAIFRHKVIPETVGQRIGFAYTEWFFIGDVLEDAGGKLYECLWYEKGNQPILRQTTLGKGFEFPSYAALCEVKGNIHDNPNLLKQEEG